MSGVIKIAAKAAAVTRPIFQRAKWRVQASWASMIMALPVPSSALPMSTGLPLARKVG